MLAIEDRMRDNNRDMRTLLGEQHREVQRQLPGDRRNLNQNIAEGRRECDSTDV